MTLLESSLIDFSRREETGPIFPVRNPATGELLAHVPAMGAAEALATVEAAARSAHDCPSLEERRESLIRIDAALQTNREELACIITREQGKPLAESRVEVDYAAGFFRFYGLILDELLPRTIEQPIRGAQWTTYMRPAGVAALITPWNFPLAMLAKKLAPAIGAGCPAVIKPAELTPLSAITLRKIAVQSGVPAERIQMLTGEPAPIGSVFCSHPAVRLISFTGSTEVGRSLMHDAAAHLKRLALELGGNAPFIVFEDADIEAAAAAVVPNKFRCAGQTCVCANRFYVHRSVIDRFTDLVCNHVSRLKVGNGMKEGTDLGPLINRAAWDKVALHVDDAVARGASLRHGGRPQPAAHDWGHYFPPVVLTGIEPGMLVTKEETFGPVVPIGSFTTEEEAVELANSTPYGLAAYVFSTDQSRIERILPRLQFGHVGINTGTGPTPEAPFGGMKQSGFGREGGIEGLLEFCEPQTAASLIA